MASNYRWSDFCIEIPLGDGGLILKSTLSGAVVQMSATARAQITDQLHSGTSSSAIEDLARPEIALVIPRDSDEYRAWQNRLLERRNDEAHLFILHFLP